MRQIYNIYNKIEKKKHPKKKSHLTKTKQNQQKCVKNA